MLEYWAVGILSIYLLDYWALLNLGKAISNFRTIGLLDYIWFYHFPSGERGGGGRGRGGGGG